MCVYIYIYVYISGPRRDTINEALRTTYGIHLDLKILELQRLRLASNPLMLILDTSTLPQCQGLTV